MNKYETGTGRLLLSGRNRHLEKWKWCYISAVSAPIWTKFNIVMQNEMQITGSDRDQNRKLNSNMADVCFSETEVVKYQPSIEICRRNLVYSWTLTSRQRYQQMQNSLPKTNIYQQTKFHRHYINPWCRVSLYPTVLTTLTHFDKPKSPKVGPSWTWSTFKLSWLMMMSNFVQISPSSADI